MITPDHRTADPPAVAFMSSLPRVLTINSHKGGTAKSVLVRELAFAARRAGLAVAVLDTDPQATTTSWAADRDAARRAQGLSPDLVVQPTFAPLIGGMLAGLGQAGVDLVLIDTPPQFSEVTSTAIGKADFVLIPTQPSSDDIKAIAATIQQCTIAGRPFGIALTRVPALEGPETVESLEAFQTQDLAICPQLMHESKDYRRSHKSGLTAQEAFPDGRAAGEVRRIWAYVRRRLEAVTSPRRRRAA